MKDIRGYEGLYKISCGGDIYSTKYNRLLNPQIKKTGYIGIILSKNKITKNYLIHRLVAEAWIPNPLVLPCVNHKDGNKLNNFPWNLEWCTYSENEQHSFNTLGKSFIGEKNNFSKLTEQQVQEIRNKYVPRLYSMNRLAKEYNISQPTIYEIITKKIWKHI